MSPAKIFLVGLWIVCGLGFFVAAESSAALVGRVIFGVLVVAHAIECLVFLPVLRKAPGSLREHLVQTFLFGIVHIREVRATADAKS
jgi:uncharacterized protein YhhL (DUF1145 family)